MTNRQEALDDIADLFESFFSKNSREVQTFAMLAHSMAAVTVIALDQTLPVEEKLTLFNNVVKVVMNDVSKHLELTESQVHDAFAFARVLSLRLAQHEGALFSDNKWGP